MHWCSIYYLLTDMDHTNYALRLTVANGLKAANKTVAVAESCTGGGLGQELTHIAGASDYFYGGFLTYANQAKQDLLGVPESLLNTVGAVSEPVAKAMAEGVIAKTGVDIALSITGIAGPGGGSVEKPVGTVWFGLMQRGEAPEARHALFTGGREAIREAAVAFALAWLRDLLP